MGMTWQPNGIESYVCEVRDKRARAAKTAARNARRVGLAETKCPSSSVIKADMAADLSKVSQMLRQDEKTSRRAEDKAEDLLVEDGPLTYWSDDSDDSCA